MHIRSWTANHFCLGVVSLVGSAVLQPLSAGYLMITAILQALPAAVASLQRKHTSRFCLTSASKLALPAD